MKKSLFLFMGLFLINVLTLNAQSENEFQFGLALPQGDFADDDYENAIYKGSGVASTGLYLGYKLLLPISDSDLLYGTFKAGIIYNDLQKDFKDEIEESFDDNDYDLNEIKFTKYLNIPIMGGLHIQSDFDGDFQIFGEGGIGFNILKLTKEYINYEIESNNNTIEIESTTTFSTSIKLGYNFGCGIIIGDEYTISLNIMNLGAHKVEYKLNQEIGNQTIRKKDNFDKSLSVNTLNITLGYRF